MNRRRFLGSGLAVTLVSLPATAPAEPDGLRMLEAREGTLRLLPEPAGLTPIWAYDGISPGPPLRYKKGEEVRVRLVNRLGQPLTLNWHGVRIANIMDGVGGLTQEPAPPGGSFDYRFTPPDSGLYWYHPHVLPLLGEQLDRGLYGVLIVDEPETPLADKDMLVVIDDWTLDGEGRIAGFGSGAEAAERGRIGPLVTLNSAGTPVTETMPPASRLRLRILSAVTSKVMLISFEGAKPWILAVDGQPCEAFEPNRQTIPVGPGARFDVMLDLPEEARARAALILRGDGDADLVLLEIRTEGARRPELPPIGSLPENPLLPRAIRLEASRKIDIIIEAVSPPTMSASGRPLHWKLNGTAWDGWARKPLFSVKRGGAVTLGLVNRTSFVQQIHVHGHHMRLLHDLDDGWEPYWRDSVLVPAGKTKHVAFVADNPGKWVIEGLMAERQCSGMAAWFEVS
jgi:FtsP/CotA-like multicopper oxidase with cupredoxin domain